MKPRPGQVLASTVDSTTVIVVRAPGGEINLTCAGVEMWDPKCGGASPGGEADPAQLTGTQMGKRYADERIGLELLCTKPGQGTIAVNGVPLPLCGPKLLPASDLAAGDRMSPQDLSFDVTEAVGSGEILSQTAWLFLPGDPTRATAVLICLAGGTYDKRYWHLEVPGRRGYSFAEHLADQGYLVVALDHLGTGGSSDPQRSGSVGLRMLAAGDAEAVAQVSARLRDGTLVPGLPPLRLPVVGVGHSMGSCLTTMVAAQASPYDAVALLGYGVQISNVQNDADGGEDLAARMNQSEAVFRRLNGLGPDEVSCVVPREHLRQLFHAPDVPGDVIAADDAAESRVPVRAASEVITPGYVAEFAAAVDVPVFLALGSHLDVSPDPYAEVANYRASRDVTLYVVEGSAHCHNFATGRIALWDRMATWIQSVADPNSALTAERVAPRA